MSWRLKERGIVVTNVPGYSTPAVAQHVIALMLELTNHVGHAAKSVEQGGWVKCPDFAYWDHPIIELAGRTLGSSVMAKSAAPWRGSAWLLA
jgi:glycerate dehydrogenase